MNKNIVITEVNSDKAAGIAELSNQLGYKISAEETIKAIEKIAAKSDEKLFCALLEDKVAGWIHVFATTRVESGDFAEIGGLVVDEKIQRAGVGRMLVDAAKKWTGKKGLSKLKVRCNVKRKDAHQFYEAMGFGFEKEQRVMATTLG